MKLFFDILRKESDDDLSLIVFMAIVSGAAGGLIVPLVLQAADDIVAGEHYLHYAATLLALTGFLIFAKRISQKRVTVLSEHVVERMLLRITNDIRHAELFDIERQQYSDLLLTIVKTQDIGRAVTKSLNLFEMTISLVFCWLYILWMSHQAGSIILIAFALAVMTRRIFQIVNADVESEGHALELALFNTFHHVLDGFKEIKINHHKARDLFDNALTPLVMKDKAHRIKAVFSFSDYHIFTDICQYMAMGSIVFLLPVFSSHTTIVMILAIMCYMGKLVLVLLAQLPDMAKGEIAFTQLQRLAEHQIAHIQPGEYLYAPSKETITTVRTIRLEDVRFAYSVPDGAFGFGVGPINLTIKAGEILFLTGGNGSGKSTLVKLITGLYRPSSGRYWVNERRVHLANHRYLFSAILSDFHLFTRFYGLEDVDENRVKALLKQMELTQKTQYVDGGFSTLNLSTGQRKRLALIVAMLEDKPVYVFDEWAADQDPSFRGYFYTQFLPSLQEQGKTIIVVSHDDRYFSAADRILRIHDGQIVEETQPRDKRL